MGNYDVFISYRRDGGEEMAIHLHDKLVAKGYGVFIDVNGLKSGRFDEKLLTEIENSKHFILICSVNCFDRCVNEDDWLRREIAHALKCRKNIIPLQLRRFEFPADLPDDIAELKYYNGIEVSIRFFDAVVDLLIKDYLGGKPASVSAPSILNAPLKKAKELFDAPVLKKFFSPAPAISNVYNAGEIISFGEYGWRVLDVQDGKALIITEDITEQRMFDDIINKWEKSELQKYLNEKFTGKLNKARIDGGIFILSIDEAKKYFKSDGDREAYYNGSPCRWWLRTPDGSEDFMYAPCVDIGGGVNAKGSLVNEFGVGVRPALWLKLNS